MGFMGFMGFMGWMGREDGRLAGAANGWWRRYL